MPGAREYGVVRDPVLDAQTTEPVVRQINLNLRTDPSLRPERKDVAHEQHSHHQFRVDRGSSGVAVKRRKLLGPMIPRDCKRLAEVDFPIAAVSRQAVQEKSIRRGHPSTLHLWSARRPLAACRAMVLALLLPDPMDSLCPPSFKETARRLLAPLPGAVSENDEGLREALLRFIGDFADWDFSTKNTYVTAARHLIRAAHGDEPPLVVDPFAGGGSIPFEALRLGCDVFASDLNPVACLILKTMLEDVPRHGHTLRVYGLSNRHDFGARDTAFRLREEVLS
jgi:Protein of unknown function (DUF1156)